MKKILVLLLLPILTLTAMASDVQSVVDALPAVEVVREMDMDQQRDIYDKTQAAYDAYMALSEEEKAKMTGAEETFNSLFGYFNTLVSPAEEVPEESGSGANILSTVLATAIGILLAQKIITRKKLK